MTKIVHEFCGICIQRRYIAGCFSGVWGGEYGDVGTVAVHIKNLRDKLHLGNDYIKTVWGVGYKLVAPHEVRV